MKMTEIKKYTVPLIWGLGLLWIFPLLYALWASTHGADSVAHFRLLAPPTAEHFTYAWSFAPFMRYMLNTITLVAGLLGLQFIVSSLAAFAFARYEFAGSRIAFSLILAQMMITPEILIMVNYRTISFLGLADTIPGIFLPSVASAFGIFLLRQNFKTVPKDLDDAARIDGCSSLGLLMRVYVPLSKTTYLAWGLVSISHHWNDFLWPLIVTSSVKTRPLTVGLAIFAAPESGVNWSVLSAGTLIAVFPLLLLFLVFQKQFTESFVMTGLK